MGKDEEKRGGRMSNFIKLHDKDDHAEFAIRVDNIREIYDIDIKSGTKICFDSYNHMESFCVEENVSEILGLIERVESKCR